MSATITSLHDLKAALATPDWVVVVQDQEAWLPTLVAATPWQTQLTKHFVLHYFADVLEDGPSVFAGFLDSSEQILGLTRCHVERSETSRSAPLGERDSSLTLGMTIKIRASA